MDDQRFEGALASCLDCAQACLRCEKSCGGYPGFAPCQQACRECFDACVLCLADLRDDPRRAASSCLGCAIASEHCADACDQYQGDAFRRCAEACRACAKLCRTIAAGSALGRVARASGSAPDGVRWASIGAYGLGIPGD
jgi:hypothetical protein